jgi:hypothetical protein
MRQVIDKTLQPEVRGRYEGSKTAHKGEPPFKD